MSDQREQFVEHVKKYLPPEQKNKAGECVVVMEEYFQELTTMMGKAYDENRLPPQLRIGLVRRLAVLMATTIYLSEGITATIQTFDACAHNMIAAKANKEAEEAKKTKIEIVKTMPDLKKV